MSSILCVARHTAGSYCLVSCLKNIALFYGFYLCTKACMYAACWVPGHTDLNPIWMTRFGSALKRIFYANTRYPVFILSFYLLIFTPHMAFTWILTTASLLLLISFLVYLLLEVFSICWVWFELKKNYVLKQHILIRAADSSVHYSGI